ncbi:MAG TPA: lysophospholipid acyltransferase family protein [Polyangia bacterium]|nr:lysophospholipid acyltransferase family protein [Polyangia bacterium]
MTTTTMPPVLSWPRRAARAAYVVYGAAVIAAVMVPTWFATLFVRRPARALALQRLASRLMLAALGCRFVVRGAWPPSGTGARVLVANHTSYLDIPLMLAALGGDFVFVTKSELLGWPIISRLTRAGGHIPVDRERAASRAAALGRIVAALRAGRSVLLFPEGTFSHDDRLRPFHAGAFRCAVTAGVPVVPIGVCGVAGVWSQHARFPRPGRIEVDVGEALVPTGGDDADEIERLETEALRFITAALGHD